MVKRTKGGTRSLEDWRPKSEGINPGSDPDPLSSPNPRLHRTHLKALLPDRRHKGTPIRLYVADLDIRIVTLEGTLLRHLILDTTRTYQPSGLPRPRVREGSRVPR